MLVFLDMLDTEEEKNRFRAVYEKYGHFLWYLANQVLCDAQLAEDAVQETFLAVTRHMDKIKEPDSRDARNFLVTVARNKAIDLLRREKGARTADYGEWEPPARGDLLEEYLRRETAEQIRRALDMLEEGYRIVLEYRYLHEMSEKEVAQAMGITPKNANIRIFRARKRLQELLKREEGIS